MATFAVSVRIDMLRSLGYASISSTYAQVGTNTAHRTRMMKITNNTSGDMFFAFTSLGSVPASDGTADNIFIPAGGFTLFDFSSNPGESGQPFVFQTNTSVWVRQSSAPTSGAVYVEIVYGKGE
jgi:hypothetical protein|uniref:Uncharacterized protein n=1 Tax=uncultured Caudovirales phage TaxID=2100421 RepID=A0A6J5KZE7_9CAUD|nr:hypothetical protein UFOVP88_6 [uncultured Caudovirales phage]